MKKKISIVGGDLRNKRLVKKFIEDGYDVSTYLMDNANLNNIKICNHLNECYDIVVGPIAFSKDNKFLNSKLSNEKMEIKDFFKALNGKTLISGTINNDNIKYIKKNKIRYFDIMQNEKFTILNIIPTVEGIIQIIMENTEYTINNSNILILGYGRIGKMLATKLKFLGANISVEARKKSDLAWIKANSYKEINLLNLKKNLNGYDIIINTIPFIILDKNMLEKIDKKTIIIEVASNPGGIDLECIEKLNLKYIKALGLPGKVAPETSAKYIKEVVEDYIKIL